MSRAEANANPLLLRFVGRNVAEVLALLCLVFVLQFSLIPFDFQTTPTEPILGELWAQATKVGIASNVMIYWPLGLLLHVVCARRLRGSLSPLLAAVGGAVALSLMLETLQAFSPTRISSSADVVANALGATAGALTSDGCRWLVPRLVGATVAAFCREPRGAIIKAYVGLLILFAALPFTFCLDVGRLKQAVKTAHLVPFASDAQWARAAEQSLAEGERYTYATYRFGRMRQWSRWAAEGTSFGLLAWLAFPYLRGRYRFGPTRSLLLIWWCGLLLAASMSVMQLTILTRGLDATDVLLRMVGLVAGSLAALVVLERAPGTGQERVLKRRLVRVACVAVGGFILFNGLIPFEVNTQAHPAAAVASSGFSPFYSYFEARFDRMANDLVGKFVAFTVLGATLSAAVPSFANRRFSSRLARVVGCGLALSVVIETAQIFLVVRVPSLTDPIIAGAACAIGVMLEAHARTLRQLGADHFRAEATAQLSPIDEWLATLAQPRPDAPREPDPRTRRPVSRRARER